MFQTTETSSFETSIFNHLLLKLLLQLLSQKKKKMDQLLVHPFGSWHYQLSQIRCDKQKAQAFHIAQLTITNISLWYFLEAKWRRDSFLTNCHSTAADSQHHVQVYTSKVNCLYLPDAPKEQRKIEPVISQTKGSSEHEMHIIKNFILVVTKQELPSQSNKTSR